jgi:hypothetical protein
MFAFLVPLMALVAATFLPDVEPPVGPGRCQWGMAHGYIFDGDAFG